MTELQSILAAAAELHQLGEPVVLATVVKVGGSTYRRPGARMLLTPAGRRVGSVSGGCLEGDVARKAWQLTEQGQAAVLRYDSTAEDDAVYGFGLGCNGTVEVLVQRVGADDPLLPYLRDTLAARRACVVVTIFRASDVGAARPGQHVLFDSNARAVSDPAGLAALCPDLSADAGWALALGQTATKTYRLSTGQQIESLVEVIEPPLPLIVFGAGWDAIPVVAAGKALGWHVTVADRRANHATPERFPAADATVACSPDDVAQQLSLTPRTHVVLMTHNYPDDARLLGPLLTSPVPYVGLLGPAHRKRRLLAQLADEGQTFTPEQLAKLYGPVGLDVGADSPAEIAASIVSEILAVRAGRRGGFLRHYQGPIHQPPTSDHPLRPGQPTARTP